MKLDCPVIELRECPPDILKYLRATVLNLDWENELAITKEEAFYDQAYRYEAVTDYFKGENFYYSAISPSDETTNLLRPYTDFLMTEVFPNWKIFRCQISCLKPGQNVYPHVDPRYYHKYGKRIHLPLKINDKSFHIHFRPEENYNMTFSQMTEGIITDFDNITPHSAFNYGNEDRIHIIIDIVKTSIVEKLEKALDGNVNASNDEITKEYYIHLKNIEEKYECKYQDLKPHYLKNMPKP